MHIYIYYILNGEKNTAEYEFTFADVAPIRPVYTIRDPLSSAF